MSANEIIVLAVAFVLIFGGSFLIYRKAKDPNTAYQREKKEGKQKPFGKAIAISAIVVILGVLFVWLTGTGV